MTGRLPSREGGNQGFTLIELLVVVLILGILMAIAIPTFLSLTGGAKTVAAEADLTTAAQDEAVYLTENGSFDSASTDPATATTDNIAAMEQADSGINWAPSAGPTAGTKTVGVEVVTAPIRTFCDKEKCIWQPVEPADTSSLEVSSLAPAFIPRGPVLDQPSLVLYLETAGADGNYYWIQDANGALLYDETTTILDPGNFPQSTGWVMAWNQLPTQVEDDS